MKKRKAPRSAPNKKFILSPQEWVLFLIPVLIALWVWFSPLAFVPVPWPDDSAFYFVAKELFRWPPRWVMLPQAPFEPTYRIFNFNTMPLFPILLGLGRWIGIDGSFWIKFWPLSAWALTGSAMSLILYRKGLPLLLSAIVAFVFALDPIHRWASVLVRPESLIGLFGLLILLGITFGFPKRLKERKLWDPVAALLAISAFTHFNAVHLIFPVVLAFWKQPKRLVRIALLTTLYLSPWLFTVVFHWQLFIHQMATQWERLAVPNNWLNSIPEAVRGLFQSLGSPEPWPSEIYWLGFAMIWLVILGVASRLIQTFDHLKAPAQFNKAAFPLLPALGWIVSSIWLFQTKPEVWFIYYVHIATWTFAGLVLLQLYQINKDIIQLTIYSVSLGVLTTSALIFGYIDLSQSLRMSKSSSWNWNTYQNFVECIDHALTQAEGQKKTPGPFQVWGPTFPDITIELSRKHPSWEMTRTNDFISRNHLALQHGWDTDAVVVTETLNWEERNISSKMEDHPEIQSLWMNWKGYYLNQLWESPGWKKNRYLCQMGRWQAFIFMK